MGMTSLERRVAAALAAIFGLRMLGLFMILPVIALYAADYSGYTATLAGLAVGAYGLAQAFLQIPMGLLSDRIGRKPVIAFGLALFAIGSVFAANADTMWELIAGRTIQGAGAIAAAVMALAADLTREEQRTKVMAIIGGSIGLAFAVALVIGPIFANWWGLSGLFWLTAGLAAGGGVVLATVVPEPSRHKMHRDTQPILADVGRVLADGQLLRLDFGILVLHAVLMASFVVVPLQLEANGIQRSSHWLVYLGVLLAAVAGMIPLIVWAERRRQVKTAFVGAVALLALALSAMAFFGESAAGMIAALAFMFLGFNYLEATLPSLISKTCPPSYKGTAMGVYSTSQFLGAFLGGLMGGWLFGTFGAGAVFLACSVLVLIWLVAAAGMHKPSHLASRLLALGEIRAEDAARLADRLRQVQGVAEAVVIAEERVAYLKVDRKSLDEEALRAFSAAKA